ncbi:MAG: hypothetical protein MI743_18705 [Sneathiellales bacterium]|nr:hypothetical protein [Sneathiellales bacterium]
MKSVLFGCCLALVAGLFALQAPSFAAAKSGMVYSEPRASTELKRLIQRGGGGNEDIVVSCGVSRLNPKNCDKFKAVCDKHGGTITTAPGVVTCTVPRPSSAAGGGKLKSKD